MKHKILWKTFDIATDGLFKHARCHLIQPRETEISYHALAMDLVDFALDGLNLFFGESNWLLDKPKALHKS